MIYGLGIAQYGSFGPDIQLIHPASRINFVIGQNNSGKSNILRLIAEHYKELAISAHQSREYKGLSEIDRPQGQAGKFQIWFGFKPDADTVTQLTDSVLKPGTRRRGVTSCQVVYEAAA